MKIKKEGNVYKIESSSKKGKFYTVDPAKPSCDCAQFIFRARKAGGVCKHITAVRETLKPDEKKLEKMLEEIKEGNNDSIDLIAKYGEAAINELKLEGEVFEKAGKLYLLE